VKLPRIVDGDGIVSYEELVGLCITFAVPGESPDGYEVVLTYFDVDGDTITIGSSDELLDAMDQFSDVLRLAAEVKACREIIQDLKPPAVIPASRGDFGSSSSPSEMDTLPPQVQYALKSFVGLLSTAVSHLQDGLTTSSPPDLLHATRESVPSTAPLPSAPPESFSEDHTGTTESSENPTGTPESLPFVHYRHTCDGCLTSPIIGKRFRAKNQADFDLCERCFATTDSATAQDFEATESECDRPYQLSRPSMVNCSPRAPKEEAKQEVKQEPKTPESSVPFIHGRHTCDSCLMTPIVGKRFHAVNVPDYDLCENCHSNYTGTTVRFEPAELERDRPFQARWNRRHEKLERFHKRKSRLSEARNRLETNAPRRSPGCGAPSPGTVTHVREARSRMLGGPAYVRFPRPAVQPSSCPTTLPTEPVATDETQDRNELRSDRTCQFDDALKEAIRRSLRDLVPDAIDDPIEGNQRSELSSPTGLDEAEATHVAMAVESVVPDLSNELDSEAEVEEPDIVVRAEEPVVVRAEDPDIVVTAEEPDIVDEAEEVVRLSLDDTRAMEDAMDTDSVDSEKLLYEGEEKAPESPRKSGSPRPSNESSFESEAAGNGDIAEAVGATLDLFAGMISEMLEEAAMPDSPATHAFETTDHTNDRELSPSLSGAVIVEDPSPEESEWQVVGRSQEDDEDIARATEMLGSLLFNSITREAEEDDSEGGISILSDSFSLPSSVPSLNVGLSQRTRWCAQLDQLSELGFTDESKCIEILERLKAANIGVDSEDEITVTQVVNTILEDQ